ASCISRQRGFKRAPALAKCIEPAPPTATTLEVRAVVEVREVAFDRAIGTARDLDQATRRRVEAAQFIAVHEAGIQTDPEWQLDARLALGRVAEHDHVRQVVRVKEELLTDPQEIFIRLL